MRLTLALLLAVVGVASAHAQSKPSIGASAITVTVDLTGSPLTGTCPYNLNLSWSAQNASVCTKSGAWSGSANASGSEVVTVNAAQQTYTLQCSSNTDSRTVTWTNPTQNTDGTAATLAGNKVYHANSSAGVESANAIILTPAKTTYLLTGLPAGPRYVGVRATGATGNLDSDMSQLANVTITLPAGSDTLQAGCTTPPTPKPPQAVTISQTLWDVVPGREALLGRDVGTVELDVKCTGKEPWLYQGDTQYWVVPKASATSIYRKPRSTYIVGQCVEKPT